MLTGSGQAANYYAVFNICEAGRPCRIVVHRIRRNFQSAGGYHEKNGRILYCRRPRMRITIRSARRSSPIPNASWRNPWQILRWLCWILKNSPVRAHAHHVPLIVDNTFPTPINCNPFKWGVDIVTHSTTKYMDGHAMALGGAIVDSGNFDWSAYPDKFPGLCAPDESYHGVVYTEKFGKAAYITKATSQLMRDLGAVQSPQNAFLLNVGLETLPLRMERHCYNAQKVAEFLEANEKVAWVNYPGLKSSKYYELAQKYMPNGTCGVISFGLKGGRKAAEEMMDKLKLAAIVTHVADSRTSILHPASHTHRQMNDEQLKEAGVAPI